MTAPPRSVPLRRRLFLLAAAAILPIAVMSAIALQALYEQQRAQGERAALEVARALATALESEIRRTTAVLEVLASARSLEAGNLAAFEQRLRRTAEIQPAWRGAILSDRDGRTLLHTGHASGEALPPLAEPTSFEAAVRTGRPVVGVLARGPRGEWAVPIRVPVMRRGQVAYVLTAPVRPESLLEVVQQKKLPEGWVMAAMDAAGTRVLRWPGQDAYVGTPASESLRAMMSGAREEAVGVTQTSEGTSVYTAYSRLPASGWHIAVGIPREAFLQAASRSRNAYAGGVALSILIGVLAALLIARSINRPIGELRQAAQALGRGERPPPTHTDMREVLEVAHALHAAAEERAAGEREREQLLRREQAARAAAEAASRAKDEFLAMLGHELRNPLGAATNAARLLQLPALDEADRRRACEIVVRQLGQLSRITDDLLEVARALMGKIVLQRQPLDLAVAVGRCIEGLRAAGKAQHHALDVELGEAWAEVDPMRLEQMLTNLIVNAIKYTPPGGHIRVSVAREGDECVIAVADDGIGLSPELAARVFDLFVQGESTLDRSQGGLGIGLTLVRRLAELHGGSVSVSSEGLGRGAEFSIRLPATERIVPPVESSASGPVAACHVLVVEDNEDARETLRILLRLAGHFVQTAADGEEGLRKALAEPPDVALVDIGLPKLDGYELARRVRRAGGARRTYLVALTGYGQREDRDRAFAAGFDAHLVKPVDPDRLNEALAAAEAARPRPSLAEGTAAE